MAVSVSGWLRKKRPMGLFSARAPVGLDLGSHTLKAAEVVRSDGVFKVRRVGMVQTPPGAVSKGVAVNPEALAPAISKLLQEAGIRSKRVVTALGGEAVVIRKVTVPEMPQAELEEAITLEAEQYLPEGVGEVRRHYRVLGRTPENGQLEVLLVAAGKEVVNRHLAPLAMAGLASPVMEVTPFSMVRAVAPGSPGEKAALYVNLGAESSDILILDKEGLRLARNIRIGGTTLTKAIAETLNLDVAAALRLKEQRAQVLLEGTPPEDAVLRQLHQAILPVITSITTELRRSLDFYQARLGSQSVSKVVLTGGTAKLKNLAPFLSGKLRVPVEIGNPFGTCEPDAGFSPEYVADVAPMMAVAVGLALRGAQA
jgi:type IV pilus assembly protein PilM